MAGEFCTRVYSLILRNQTMAIVLFSIICACFISSPHLVKSERDAVNRIKWALFHNSSYNDKARPVLDPAAAVAVSLKMWIFHVEDVNDEKQTIKFHGFMQMGWRDEFLQWKREDYNGTQYIMTNNYAIWTPKLMLLNSAASNTFNYVWNLPVKLWYTGDIYAAVEMTVTSTCAFDFSNYPNDVQRCPVAFYLGGTMDQVKFTFLAGPELRLYWRQGDADSQGNKLSASNWEIVGEPEGYRKYFSISGLNDTLGSEPYYSVTMIFEAWISFRRRLSYFGTTIVLPAVLTSTITLLAMMPMETVYSLSLLLLNLLAQGTYVDDLFIVLPKSIGTVPKIAQYYIANMILTVLGVFARLLIQLSLNKENRKLKNPSNQDENAVDSGQSILEREKTSCMDSFFSFATSKRLNILFLLAYFLVYSTLAMVLL